MKITNKRIKINQDSGPDEARYDYFKIDGIEFPEACLIRNEDTDILLPISEQRDNARQVVSDAIYEYSTWERFLEWSEMPELKPLYDELKKER